MRAGVLFTLLAAATLSGCATPYTNAANPITGFFGGYWDAPGPGELIKVGFSGNAFIDKQKVGVYLLYHCAQVAQRQGKNYFALYQNLPAAIADRRSTDKTVTTITGKPTDYVYILLFDEPGRQLLSAQELLTQLKPEMQEQM